eukprot:193148-Chlamydomonas_euryale.AAC.1
MGRYDARLRAPAKVWRCGLMVCAPEKRGGGGCVCTPPKGKCAGCWPVRKKKGEGARLCANSKWKDVERWSARQIKRRGRIYSPEKANAAATIKTGTARLTTPCDMTSCE